MNDLMNDLMNSSKSVNEYSININSINRELLPTTSPFNFTVWLNSTSTIERSFKNVKFVAIDHITFPTFIQIIKHYVTNSDLLYNDINEICNDLTATINEQYEYNGNTYEICNKYEENGKTYINFTINENKLTCYEYVKSDSSFTIYKYLPIELNSISNTIQYISIDSLNNMFIHNTNGHNMFKYVLPKLKTDTNLYSYLKHNKTVFRDSCLQHIKKMQISILDSNSNVIKLNNLDPLYSNSTKYSLNEPSDYSSPNYYLRHPLNPRFQVDLFLRIGCYE
jgi:hypothetical protein